MRSLPCPAPNSLGRAAVLYARAHGVYKIDIVLSFSYPPVPRML
jgi:hypothetical protein